MEQVTQLLLQINVFLHVWLAIRLVFTQLHTRYRAFFVWVCFIAFRDATAALIAERKVMYMRFWLITEPLLVLIFILVVFEVYSLALQAYPGIRTASSRLLTLALIIASVISVVSIFPDLQLSTATEHSQFLLVNVIRRGVYTSLLTFLVLLVSFISVYPIKLSRNTILHVILFSTVFLFNAATILAMNLQGLDVIALMNVIETGVSIICSLGWILFLVPASEAVTASVRPNLSVDDAAKMIRQLKGLNDSLGASRKKL